MKNIAFIMLLLFLPGISVLGQKPTDALAQDSKSLQERFQIMRDESETYGEYKVVRKYVLDGVWKIVNDTLKAKKVLMDEANASIVDLEGKLATVKSTIKSKEEAIDEMQFDGNHIKFFGVDFAKNAFVVVVGIIVLGLLVLLGVLFVRLRWIHSAIKEKTETAELLSAEFEEYKRKALEKQMKLSRELQTERNKLQELRS